MSYVKAMLPSQIQPLSLGQNLGRFLLLVLCLL
jgi:hypothetical protein